MEWQEISGSWVLIPENPLGIVHFLGGAFVAAAPNLTYRWLLESLAREGFAIITTPFINTLDHLAIARNVLNRFESILNRLQASQRIPQKYLPIYGIGHSLGCKLHLLIGSLFGVERAGNILISFNNYPLNRAIPWFEQWDVANNFNVEFTPSPVETQQIVTQGYQVRRNLLIRFQRDDIDETSSLEPLLSSRFQDLISLRVLPGNHLTPLSQELNWQTGEIYTPLDAIGQWFKQNFSRDLQLLNAEISRWLNPVGSK